MRILVTGSSGLVGTKLVKALEEEGHKVLRLVRTKKRTDEVSIFWNPADDDLATHRLEGLDAAIHLAGDNIASGRWNEAKKYSIRASRVQGTRLLSETLASLSHPPSVLLSASAIGFYGNRGEEVLTEESHSGTGFLAEVCQAWEEATKPAQDAGLRVVHLRLGMVLSAHGGALANMLTPFRLGLGGKVGDGKQYWSWISNTDLISAIQYVLQDETISGPVNLVAPQETTCEAFSKILGTYLRRPTVLPLPAFMARLLIGEMADALLLSSARVKPARLMASSFNFQHETLEEALKGELGQG